MPSNNIICVSFCGQGGQAQFLLKHLSKGIMLSQQALAPCASSAVARAKGSTFQVEICGKRHMKEILAQQKVLDVLSHFQVFLWDCPSAEPRSTPGLRGGQGQKPQWLQCYRLSCPGHLAAPWANCTSITTSGILPLSLALTFNSQEWGLAKSFSLFFAFTYRAIKVYSCYAAI